MSAAEGTADRESAEGEVAQRLRISLATHHREMLGMTMPEALDRAAETWGTRAAMTMIEGMPVELTWSELRSQVGSLRSGFESVGVKPGEKVVVMLGNRIEFPLTWLAVIEAGAVSVPVNPAYTGRELEFVLVDSDASWLVTDTESFDRLAQHGRVSHVPAERIIIVDPDPGFSGLTFSDLLATTATTRTHQAHPRDVVNIQFTSGTTGPPKGCLLTHEYWVEFGAYSAALFGDPQRLLADHPFYYMQNQAYFTIALASGGALFVTHGLSRRKFKGWLHDYRIDFAWIDKFILDEPEMKSDKELVLRKSPMSGLSGHAHRQVEDRFDLQVRDWYASTEAGNGTFVPWERSDLVGTPTIGLVWPTRESKIIDSKGCEVAHGEAGELCLRGSGMMLGYHNRPEVNEDLFLPGGWYRTGDVVRKDVDGLHYYIGRIKDMIRRSGENISCAEVELFILEHSHVSEVGVVPVPDDFRGEEVKAIVVLKKGTYLSAADVEQWCRAGLAAFKIPRFVEFRDHLPKTSSGKVAKAILRDEPSLLGHNVVDLRPHT